MQKVVVAALFTVVMILTSCGNSVDQNLPPSNSMPVQATQNFPAVVRILSIGQLCSGVFISPQALLTASHCVRPNSKVTVQTDTGRFESSLVLKNGPGREGDSEDIAIVVFPQTMIDRAMLYPIGTAYLGEIVHLVGYGCNDSFNPRSSGIKRTGTNSVYRISQYIEVLTPVRAPEPRNLLGPSNRAGSCFGDSGGPMLKQVGEAFYLLGIDHAVIPEGGQQISAYTNLSSPTNRTFLKNVNAQFQLAIEGL